MEAWKQQGSPEWLAKRLQCVTSTDVAAIMGLNPWETAYKRWCRKLGLIARELENEAMREGKRKEAFALAKLNSVTGFNFVPDVVLHPEYNWMMASLDGVDYENKVITEIKCGVKSHASALKGEIPSYYFCQVQFALECLSPYQGIYSSYQYDHDYVNMDVLRDDAFIAEMIPKCREFYECMMTLTPPELTDKDYVEVEDEYQLSRLSDLASLKRQIKKLEDQEKIIAKEVKQFATDSQCNLKGAGLRISNRATRGIINYKAIPELEGVDLEPYRKAPTQYWEIRMGD